MNKLLLGLATYIMQKTVNGCFTEKTSRVPLWLKEVEPISDSWKGPLDEFRQSIAAKRAWERIEQRLEELEQRIPVTAEVVS